MPALLVTIMIRKRKQSASRTGSLELAVEMAEYFHVSLDYLLLEETESNRKAKRDSLIMVYFQHPSFGSHSVTGTLS